MARLPYLRPAIGKRALIPFARHDLVWKFDLSAPVRNAAHRKDAAKFQIPSQRSEDKTIATRAPRTKRGSLEGAPVRSNLSGEAISVVPATIRSDRHATPFPVGSGIVSASVKVFGKIIAGWRTFRDLFSRSLITGHHEHKLSTNIVECNSIYAYSSHTPSQRLRLITNYKNLFILYHIDIFINFIFYISKFSQ